MGVEVKQESRVENPSAESVRTATTPLQTSSTASSDPSFSIAPTNQGPPKSEPNLPQDFRSVEISPAAASLFSGTAEENQFDFSTDPLPLSLFENSTSFNNYTWESFEFGGMLSMGTEISNLLGDNAEQYSKENPGIWSDIDNSFGFLLAGTESLSTGSTVVPVKDRPLPKVEIELKQNVVDSILSRDGYFHSTTGESRGRAFKARIENSLEFLQKKDLDLNDPEVKKMVVAVARQLYSEGALEPNQVPLFHELLKMKEFGREISSEQLDKVIGGLSQDQVKKLLDGSVVTLKERLISPPKAWKMNKSGVITDGELETVRGKKDASLREVWDVVEKVWSKDEIFQAEATFHSQTGYNTGFYQLSQQTGSFSAAITVLEGRSSGIPGNAAYLSTLTSSSGETGLNIPLVHSALIGTQKEVLYASGELFRAKEEEDKKEKAEQAGSIFSGGYEAWVKNPLVTALAVAGQPDKVLDLANKKYVSTDEVSGNNSIKPVVLSTYIKLDTTDDEKA